MKRIILLLGLLVLFLLPKSVKAQTFSISLEVFQDLTSLDLGGLVLSGGLTNQPRIARLVIVPENRDVFVELIATWKKDLNSSFQQLLSFKSEVFKSRIVFNDEFGSIIKGSATWNKDLITELVAKGKPTGVLGLTARLYDRNNILTGQDYKELVFLNPSPTISVISPIEGSSYDVGSVVAMWTPVQGASSYKILAAVVPDGSSNLEAALKGTNPLINNHDVGNVTSIDLRTILNREWIGGQRIVFTVSAVIIGTGGGSTLTSVPVTFILNKQGEVSVPIVNPELLKLAELINGQVSQAFIKSILSGQISIERISDEKDQNIDQVDFSRLLSSLLINRDSIISIKFMPK